MDKKRSTQELIVEFAKNSDIDLVALESLTSGVTSRIESFGIEKFNSLPYAQRITVLNEAIESYFSWAEKYHSDLENNIDGAFDKLLNEVYELVKKDKH